MKEAQDKETLRLVLLRLKELPVEMVEHIITSKGFSAADMMTLAQSDIVVAKIAQTDAVWRRLYERDFPNEWAFCDNGTLPPFLDAQKNDLSVDAAMPWKRFYVNTRSLYTDATGKSFASSKRYVEEEFERYGHVIHMARIFLRYLLRDEYAISNYNTLPPDDPELYLTLSDPFKKIWECCYAAENFFDEDLNLFVLSREFFPLDENILKENLKSLFQIEDKDFFPQDGDIQTLYENFCGHVKNPNIFTYYMTIMPRTVFSTLTFCMHGGHREEIRELLTLKDQDEEAKNQLTNLLEPMKRYDPEVVLDLFEFLGKSFASVVRSKATGKIYFVQASPLSANASSMI